MAELILPLRGLAGEGAQRTVDAALHGVPGVISARARIVEQVLVVHFDETRITADELHDVLKPTGIAHVADAPDEAKA